MNGQQTRTRTSSPARWTAAAARAIAEGIQIRQLAGSGQWVATSGSDAAAAYEVEVTGNVAHGCTCLAGLNDDPVCKHTWRRAGGLSSGLSRHVCLRRLQRLRRLLPQEPGASRLALSRRRVLRRLWVRDSQRSGIAHWSMPVTLKPNALQCTVAMIL